MKDSGLGCLAIFGIFALLIFLIFFQPWLVMMLWNYVMVSVFAAPVLTYWQAFCLNWLCGLLFRHTVTVKRDK